MKSLIINHPFTCHCNPRRGRKIALLFELGAVHSVPRESQRGLSPLCDNASLQQQLAQLPRPAAGEPALARAAAACRKRRSSASVYLRFFAHHHLSEAILTWLRGCELWQ